MIDKQSFLTRFKFYTRIQNLVFFGIFLLVIGTWILLGDVPSMEEVFILFILGIIVILAIIAQRKILRKYFEDETWKRKYEILALKYPKRYFIFNILMLSGVGFFGGIIIYYSVSRFLNLGSNSLYIWLLISIGFWVVPYIIKRVGKIPRKP